MMRIFLLSVVILCKLSAAHCQYPDSLNYYLNFAGTGNINKTNDGSTYLFNNAAKFNCARRKVSINTVTSWIYGADPTRLTNNDFSSILDMDIFKSVRKLYYWGLASYESSYSLKIQNRFQTGGGIGYSFFRTKNTSLVVSDGLLYETSRLGEPDSHGRLKYQTARNSFRLKFRFVIKDIVVLDGINFLQNSLSDGDDYIIKSTTTASVKLYKWLSLTTGFTYNRLNLLGTENLFFNYGLMMEKYF